MNSVTANPKSLNSSAPNIQFSMGNLTVNVLPFSSSPALSEVEGLSTSILFLFTSTMSTLLSAPYLALRLPALAQKPDICNSEMHAI